ncbi:hypothetical protein SprV_0100426600 [Sparganum proliferum]
MAIKSPKLRVQLFGKFRLCQKPNFEDSELVKHILNLCAQATPTEVVISASSSSLRLISAENKVIGRLNWSQGVQALKVDSKSSTFTLFTETSEQKKSDCFVIRLLEQDSEARLYSDLVRWQLDSVLRNYGGKSEEFLKHQQQQPAKEWKEGQNICKYESVSQGKSASAGLLVLGQVNKRMPLAGSNKGSSSEDANSEALSIMSTNVPSVKNCHNRLPRMVVLRGDFDEDYIKNVGERLGRRAYGPQI